MEQVLCECGKPANWCHVDDLDCKTKKPVDPSLCGCDDWRDTLLADGVEKKDLVDLRKAA